MEAILAGTYSKTRRGGGVVKYIRAKRIVVALISHCLHGMYNSTGSNNIGPPSVAYDVGGVCHVSSQPTVHTDP